MRRIDKTTAGAGTFTFADFLGTGRDRRPLTVSGLTIAFGGVRAATDVALTAEPGRVTALIGPNGAGKTTVLNMIGGFYEPDAGSIRLGDTELAGASAPRVARAGIARTYQTTQLFGSLSVLDNVLLGLRRGRLGNPFAEAASAADRRDAEGLLAFVGYKGALGLPAADLPHVDRRLVEIARALATRPSVLLLDEPAAGLMRADKAILTGVLRKLADAGLAVILVEHDMTLVMGISDHIVVLDAGRPIAAGTPEAVRSEPKVREAYLGSGEMQARPRAVPAARRTAARARRRRAQSRLQRRARARRHRLRGRPGRARCHAGRQRRRQVHHHARAERPAAPGLGLDQPRRQRRSRRAPPHRIVRAGLILVPEGRQVFPELSVRDNLLLGAHARKTSISRPRSRRCSPASRA